MLSDETVDTVVRLAESEQAYHGFCLIVYTVLIGDVAGAVATLRPAYRWAEAARGNPEAGHPPR